MGFASGDHDEIPSGHGKRLSILEFDDGRPPTKIMEHGIRTSRQCQTPRTTEFVVEQLGPTETNAIKQVGDNISDHRVDEIDADGVLVQATLASAGLADADFLIVQSQRVPGVIDANTSRKTYPGFG